MKIGSVGSRKVTILVKTLPRTARWASLIVAAATMAGCPRSDTATGGYVPVSASCLVYHSGIHIVVTARGAPGEATGTIEKLECNGKDVPLAGGAMVDGVIVTREYGRVKIHIRTGLASPGIVDDGISPDSVEDIAVQQSFAYAFTARLR
jgi:hypothetical protein